MMPTINLMMHCVQRMRRLLVMLVFTLSAGALAATETDPIVISISPFLAPQVLLKNYAPMDAYLNKKLGRSVSFVTAPDYRRTQPFGILPIMALQSIMLLPTTLMPPLCPTVRSRRCRSPSAKSCALSPTGCRVPPPALFILPVLTFQPNKSRKSRML